MLSMMEELHEAANSLVASSPSYETPPQIASPSPSAQLNSFEPETPGGLFFASSASHTTFQPHADVEPIDVDEAEPDPQEEDDDDDDNDDNADHDHEDEDGENNQEDVNEDTNSASPRSPSSRIHTSEPQTTQPDSTIASDSTSKATTTILQPADKSTITPHDPTANDTKDNDTEDDPSTPLGEILLHPWTDSSKTLFHQKFSSSNPQYKNKLRLTPAAEARVRHFILNPSCPLDPSFPADARLKARSRGYILHPFSPSGLLYRTDTSSSSSHAGGSGAVMLRRHISASEVWDLLTSEHVRSGHKGRDRMLGLIKERFVGYTLEELMFVLQECRVCRRARGTAGILGEGGAGTGGGGVDLAQRVRRSLGVMQMQQQLHLQQQQQQMGEGVGVQVQPPLTLAVNGEVVLGVQQQPQSYSQQVLGQEQGQGQSQGQRGRLANKRLPYGPSLSVGPAPPPPSGMAVQHQQQPLQQDPARGGRRSLWATDERGTVAYDVPDWYWG